MSALIALTAASAVLFGGSKLYEGRTRSKAKKLVTVLQKRPTVRQNQTSSTVALIHRQGEQWQHSLSSLLGEVEEEYHLFIKTRIDPLFQSKRYELVEEILSTDDQTIEITPYERRINRQFAMSIVLTTAAITTASMSATVQFVACMPLALYLIRNVYRQAFRSLKEERRLTISVLGAVNQTLLWFGGFYTLGGVIFVLSNAGQKLSFLTEARSQKHLVNIFGKLPQHVWILQDDLEIEIPFDQLEVGDVLVISAGQTIPIDGVIIHGYASIDQHRLNGESQPAEKEINDDVLAGTVVLAGRIHVRVEKTGQETVAAQIGEMLNQTASYQMSITTKARQMADSSVGPTLGAAALAGLVIGPVGATAITSTIFGLNLLISGPLALRNYLLIATRRNILVKDGRSLDLLTEIDTIIFDKTGTLTLDQPHVTQVHTFTAMGAVDILRYAAAVEQRQNHPIARAILAYIKEQDVCLPKIAEASYEVGYGLQAEIEGRLICVGSDRFMALKAIPLAKEVQSLQQICHAQGHSLVMVAMNEQLVGAIELEPTIRPEAKDVIDELRRRNLDFYIISGDQEGPTRKLAQTLGIDNYFANTLPENKAQLVEQLQQEGRAVCFVGDGINDSIALKKANVSVSLRGSTTVAIDTAQIVLMDTTLAQLPLLFQLAEEMRDNLKTTRNLAIVPSLGIWAGVFFFHLGILGAALIFEASLWVGIANAMRPLLTDQAPNK